MSDTAIGFLIVGLGMLVVLAVVFAISSRPRPSATSTPPAGVHLPPPSYLPVVLSIGVALIGAGLAFRAEGQLANPFLAIPGLIVFVFGILSWVRAANREWREVEGALTARTSPTTTTPPTDPTMTAGRGVPELRRLPRRVLVATAVVPLLLLGVLGVALLLRGPSTSPTTIGSVAPDFSLVDLDGNTVRLSELRGRPVIVNFWASWCGPCVEEFPLLREAADEHGDDGLVVLGIVYQDRSEAARAFMQRNGGTWSALMDPGERVAQAYNIFAPPETYFVGRDGTIVARHIGQFTAASLEDKVAAIMDEE